MSALPFRFNDGGRAAAGFKGSAGDCAYRSLAIAMDVFYIDVFNELNQFAETNHFLKHKRINLSTHHGPDGAVMRQFLEELGWKWIPTISFGSGCQARLRQGDLPDGHLIVNVSHHYTTLINGVINDTVNPSRNGTRCVYGYWFDPEFQQEEPNRV